jgi:hypothetical protein
LRAGLSAFVVASAGHALGAWDLAAAAPRLPSLCPVHALTGHDCPGCGMTRALLALAQGDPVASFRQHPFALPVLLWAAAAALLPPIRLLHAEAVRMAAAVALLGWWMVRTAG